MSRHVALVSLALGAAFAAMLGSRVSLSAAPQAPQQFRSGVEVVEVTVTVTDERGRPVTGLTRGDFTILEEGRPQSITVFGTVDLPAPLLVPPDRRAATPGPVVITTNDVAPDGRVFALVLDDQLTQPFRTMAVRRLARQFVERHVGPQDLVGVFSTGGRGRLTQEFTTDKTRVVQTIDRFQGNRIRSGETDPERVYDVQTSMDTIGELANHLRGIRGRRIAVLWISEGIDYNVFEAMAPSPLATTAAEGPPPTFANLRGTPSVGGGIIRERDPQPTPVIRAVQEAMDALARANVVLYGIDPRGLYSQEGEWVEFNPQDGTGPPPPDPQELARSIQSLRTVSERTGGFAVVNSNDFGPDFGRIVEESSHYYVLGYSPSRRGEPGEYRRIAVRVRPGLRVSAREGYVVPPVRAPAPPARAVLAALDDSLPQPHLLLRVQAIPLPPKDAGSRVRPVQIVLEIDGAALAFREENGHFSERLELAVKTLDDLAQEGNRTATEMALPPLSAAQRDRITRNGLRWLTTFDAAPGHYTLRVAAHSTTAGRAGSVFVDLDVPPIDASKVVLGELVLTATAAPDTPTAGAPSMLPPLPGPATTRRVFRQGEAVTVAAAVESATAPVVTATLRRLDVDLDRPPVTATIPVAKSEGGIDYVLFSLPPEAREPGRFAVTIAARSLGGESSQRGVIVEVVATKP
jgi:VWFA-related protein